VQLLKIKNLGISLLLFLILFVSCNKKDSEKPFFKEVFYKVITNENELKGYTFRKYFFINDTIIENFLSFDLKYNIKSKRSTRFLKSKEGIYIFSKWNNEIRKDVYFLVDKDSCYFIQQQFKKFDICYKGNINFEKYKNVYEIRYEEHSDDGNLYSMIFNNDHTLIAKFDEGRDFEKEILINKSSVPYEIISKVDSVLIIKPDRADMQ
jgi:hypothetical protein